MLLKLLYNVIWNRKPFLPAINGLESPQGTMQEALFDIVPFKYTHNP